MTKPQLILPFVAACALALAGCNYNSYVYRIDVPQGNLITEEMAEQVRPGMTREQVHFLFGCPKYPHLQGFIAATVINLEG